MSLRARLVIASLWFGAASCFGHSIQRPDPTTLVENLGADRYTYHLTRLAEAPPRGPATPVLAAAPAGAQELGLIEVTGEYGGDAAAMHQSEAEFYPTLAKLAGEMGGTHFLVLRSTQETRLGHWIAALTVDVLNVPAAQ
jgi:hypothetical protein